MDLGASDFGAAVLLQIKVERKMLGRSVTFGPKNVEKHFQEQNLKVIKVTIWLYDPWKLSIFQKKTN